ncbi:MAG: glycosyltransferase family 2 protein [Nostocaceae cyanobacterium]|nr:glycosyltransferase family 2 protein [Nostocaceae cyanobacterium]
MISTKLDFPSLSVAIPTYNESADIERVIRGFLSTQYPNLKEIFVADGDSTDGTQEIVRKISIEDSRVKLINNPLKVQSAGLNLMLDKCSGDIFLRADAHSDYAPDYIEKCVEALLESKALNVGGAQRFVAKTPFQAGIALASKTFLGSGGAKYRNPKYNGYADTVYLGCFWRKILQTLTGYCIEATPNEDSELNIRLKKYTFDLEQTKNQEPELNQSLQNTNNQAIYVSSKIQVWYYPRTNWKSLWIQYFKYGRGRYLTSTKHSNQLQLRGKLPFFVLSMTILMAFIDLFFPQLRLPIIEFIPLGILFPFMESLRVNWKYRSNFKDEFWRGSEEEIPSFLSRWFFCGVTLLTMPIAHFSGYTYQLFRHRVLRVDGW